MILLYWVADNSLKYSTLRKSYFKMNARPFFALKSHLTVTVL